MDAKIEAPYNHDIIKAVRYLYGEGIISNDKDIVEKTGYGKSTVSEYISGKAEASKAFRTKFEESFGVNLTSFGDAKNSDAPKYLPGKVLRTIEDYVHMLEWNNKTLSIAIQEGLVELKINLKDVADKLEAADQSARTDRNIMMETLGELSGKGREALLEEADNVERDLRTLKKQGRKKQSARK